MDMLAAHAAAEALYALLRTGVLDTIRDPHTAAEVATRHGMDSAAAAVILEFLARTTNLVTRRGERFELAADAAESVAWRALLEKFIGAYGPAVRNCEELLMAPSCGGAAIDRAALARAFEADDESMAVVRAIIDLQPRGVLDLGCGQGSLLARVCGGRSIRGWGIDRSSDMCRAARARLTAAGLEDQVTIRCTAVDNLARWLGPAERRRVDVVCAASLFNEWMADYSIAVAMLLRLAKWFPGRSLVVVDYLGALGHHRRAGRYTYLTDLIQSLTGQGVAPPSHSAWGRIYQAAGARLVMASEGRTLDLRWFVHVVVLPNGSMRVDEPARVHAAFGPQR